MPSSATPAIYTLSLHDALPIFPVPDRDPRERDPPHGALGHRLPPLRRREGRGPARRRAEPRRAGRAVRAAGLDPHLQRSQRPGNRSEEHTSELQSRGHLVCRLLPHPRSTLFPYTTLFRSFLYQIAIRENEIRHMGLSGIGFRRFGDAKAEVPHVAALNLAALVALFVPRDLIRTCNVVSGLEIDRKSTRLNSSHVAISYAVFCHTRDLHSFPTRRSSDLSCTRSRSARTRSATWGSRASASAASATRRPRSRTSPR